MPLRSVPAWKVLYVFYCLSTSPELESSSFLKKIDLDQFDGGFLQQPSTYARDVIIPGARVISLIDDALVICGALPEVLNLDDSTILYTQVEGKMNPDWEPASWVHHWGASLSWLWLLFSGTEC